VSDVADRLTAPVVVVVIPVYQGASMIGATVETAGTLVGVDRVVVIDDGSTDGSGDVAEEAGAAVVRLDVNQGKAAAIRAGVAAVPDADIVLLLDADLGATASGAAALLGPVLAGEADMAIGVLPPAGRRGGFGLIRRLAAAGVHRACGFEAAAPLSGQRVVRRSLLESVGPVARFGLEVALTIDVIRAGGRVVEIPIDVDHAHTGRALSGFRHRARQGVDILRALWPRLTTRRLRMALPIVGLVLFVVASLLLTPSTDLGRPLAGRADKVVVFGIPGLGLEDVEAMPTLRRLSEEGAFAATNVRTGGDTPRPWAAYATISAGVRVDAIEEARSIKRNADETVTVAAMAETRRAAGRHVTSEPGAVGSALRRAGFDTTVASPGRAPSPPSRAPDGRTGAALSLADRRGDISGGVIDPGSFAPVERRWATGEPVRGLVASSDVIVVDPGFSLRAPYSGSERTRRSGLAQMDRELASVIEVLPDTTLLLVVGVTPPTDEWALTPTVAWGAGVDGHRLASPTARRPDLVTLTDIGPTVLAALGVERPDGMAGQALRIDDGTVDRTRLERLDDVARGRESTYFRMTITFIFVQSLVHAATWGLLATGRLSRHGARAARVVRAVTLVCAAWPLSTYLIRVVPTLMTLGPWTHLAPWPVALVVAALASRFRRHPLAPLALVSAATAALIVADLATGAHLQVASILGTAPHTTYRFNGLGNVGFAVLATTAIVAVAIHVDTAPRRREALVTGAAALGVVFLADVAPWMGADVGGALTLVPVFGLTVAVLAGRRIRAGTVALAAVVAVAALAALVGLDLLRAPEARTHLARFVTDTVADGDLGEAVGRRWAANTRMFTQSAWTWAVVPLALGFAWAVSRSAWLRARAPLAPATRVGVLGALAVGLLGWLLNDSGVVVTALVLIYVPAVLTVAAMEPLAGRPGPVPRPSGADLPAADDQGRPASGETPP